jgi:hypothetical protein
VPVGHCRLFILAYMIRGKCTRMMFKFDGSTCIDRVCLQGYLPAASEGTARVACAVTPPIGGQARCCPPRMIGVSSASSSTGWMRPASATLTPPTK